MPYLWLSDDRHRVRLRKGGSPSARKVRNGHLVDARDCCCLVLTEMAPWCTKHSVHSHRAIPSSGVLGRWKRMRLEMRRPAKQSALRRWPPWILMAALVGVSTVDLILPAPCHLESKHPAAFKQFESSPHGVPATGHQPLASDLRRSSSGAMERERGSGLLLGLIRQLLDQPVIYPGSGSRLDYCSEFTKPDSLRIRLMGTPKNHRSPPA